ncbi:hypothetical protein ACIRPH_06255 [Nocardiopsis sp. NPDC101807]|uniref:hypothetical protein n=1 Tax=Nocardiopsis sp. NPDC101807 TaxID=3364339 RepID=UPI0038307D55
MSPKKRKRRKDRPTGTVSAAPRAQGADAPPARAGGRISRTPVVVADPPDRRITLLWVVLTLVWALGTFLALANLLFTAMDLQDAAVAAADPTAPAPQEAMDAVGNALVWVLVLALGVPAAGAVTALVLRRRIAAIGFTAALVLSAAPLLWVMPPAELWGALSAHFGG